MFKRRLEKLEAAEGSLQRADRIQKLERRVQAQHDLLVYAATMLLVEVGGSPETRVRLTQLIQQLQVCPS